MDKETYYVSCWCCCGVSAPPDLRYLFAKAADVFCRDCCWCLYVCLFCLFVLLLIIIFCFLLQEVSCWCVLVTALRYIFAVATSRVMLTWVYIQLLPLFLCLFVLIILFLWNIHELSCSTTYLLMVVLYFFAFDCCVGWLTYIYGIYLLSRCRQLLTWVCILSAPLCLFVCIILFLWNIHELSCCTTYLYMVVLYFFAFDCCVGGLTSTSCVLCWWCCCSHAYLLCRQQQLYIDAIYTCDDDNN
jgi:hypothetical protein